MFHKCEYNLKIFSTHMDISPKLFQYFSVYGCFHRLFPKIPIFKNSKFITLVSKIIVCVHKVLDLQPLKNVGSSL